MVAASVARLRELARSIPRPGCEWEDQPTFQPPASLLAIDGLERAAGFPLPADLRTFLAITDEVIGMSVHNGYQLGGTKLMAQLVGSASIPREVPDGLAVSVAQDGGGNMFLISAAGSIWAWDHETGRTSHVAESFGSFLERVVEDWAAYITDTPGWRYLV